MYKLEDYKIYGDHAGNLVALEQGEHFNFDVKRIYYIWGTERNAIRGRHAHRNLKQLIVCLKGSCVFKLDDGKKVETFTLDRPTLGIFVEDFVWREFTDFSPDCIVMVLASEHYNATDYIRDYNEFLREVNDK
ncbi:MAG: FdtA/QdtA family cupin domain-containing protein [Desulfovibrio sp.]|nr:FdtA/QdtA family cupin domain-containing protein [Desulfovibrio sp.]